MATERAAWLNATARLREGDHQCGVGGTGGLQRSSERPSACGAERLGGKRVDMNVAALTEGMWEQSPEFRAALRAVLGVP